jgi:hypothetical protein
MKGTQGALMQKVIEQRDQLQKQVEGLRLKIEGLNIAIELLNEGAPDESEQRARQEHVTDRLIELLREVGTKGLNARTVADIAADRGLPLKRQSVSSLLSRLKKDGTVVYENGRYKLPKFSGNNIAVVTARDSVRAA